MTVLLYCAIYGVVMGLVYAIDYAIWKDNDLSIVAALFWPVMVPLLMTLRVVWFVMDKIDQWRNRA